MTSDKQAAHWLETLNRCETERASQSYIDVPEFCGAEPDDADDVDLGEELDDLVLELDVDEELNLLVRKQKTLKARIKQIERREVPKLRQDFDEFRKELAKLLTGRKIANDERAGIKRQLGNLNLKVHNKLKAIEDEQRTARRQRLELAERQRAFVHLTRHMVTQINRADKERTEIRADAEKLTNRVDGHGRDVTGLKTRTAEHHADIKRLFEHGADRSRQIAQIDQRLTDLAGTVRTEAEVRSEETEMIAEFVRQMSERDLAELREIIRIQTDEHDALKGRVNGIEDGLMAQARLAATEPVIESLDPDDDVTYDETEITEIMSTRQPRQVGRTVAKAAVAAAVLAFALLVPIMDYGSKNPPAHADECTSSSELVDQESTTCQSYQLLDHHILLFECPDGVDRRCARNSKDATGTYKTCTVYKTEQVK